MVSRKVKAFVGNNVEYSGGYQQSTGIKNIDFSIYSLNSQQIAAQVGAVSARATLYTVPNDYTLFITVLNIVCRNDNATGISERGKIILNGQNVIRLYTPAIQNQAISESLSFPTPFILKSGESIVAESESSAGLTQVGMAGFLVKNSDLIQK